MASVTGRINSLAAQRGLGAVVKCYGPHPFWRAVGGLFLIAVGAVWALGAAAIGGSDLIPAQYNPFTVTDSPDDSGFARYFPLFGGLFILFGVIVMIQAARLVGARVAVCAYGFAVNSPKVTDAVRWNEILTVTHRKDVHHTTNMSSSGYAGTTTHVRDRFTVHLHDGRKIVLDSHLIGRKVHDVAEQVQIGVARAAQWR
jgi:hypothetical protein